MYNKHIERWLKGLFVYILASEINLEQNFLTNASKKIDVTNLRRIIMKNKISIIDKLFRGKKKESNCCSFEIEEVKEENSCCSFEIEEVKEEDSCNCSSNDKLNSCCSKK